MLVAADISSHNTITNWGAFLGSIDILIVKISQGTGYLWAGAPPALTQARGASKGVGAYHFASATDPVAEADYFLDHYDWRAGEVPILDWEPTSPPADPDGWCAAWCQRVIGRIGVVPMVYMSATTARSATWARTRALNAGLWVAQYGANTGDVPSTQPSVGSWGGYAMWQYTSNGSRPGVSGFIDLSQFYGDANAWHAYGTPSGGDMPLTQQDLDNIWAYVIAGVQARDRLQGLDSIQVPQLRAQVDAIKTELDAVQSKVTALQQPTVDVNALATALASNPTFLAAIAKAVLDAEAARLQS